jgi:hypothetical protein
MVVADEVANHEGRTSLDRSRQGIRHVLHERCGETSTLLGWPLQAPPEAVEQLIHLLDL